MKFLTFLLSLILFIPAAKAEEFSFTFDWGSIPLCTSGQPDILDNPFFKLKNVPKGTQQIIFKLVDENAPKFKHGSGMVEYKQFHLIKPGAFKYKGPCPADGTHSYTWTAYALDRKKEVLSIATSTQEYPPAQ